ncbi:MAG: hypothetical protein ACRECA_05320 [Pseudolabrys sp.]
MIKITGRVRSGRGMASAQLAGFMTELEKVTHEAIRPGTLNIILDRPMRLNEAEAFFFDRNSRMVWPARLNDMNVWVYRWKHSALHVVEVLSSVNLRSCFDLKDGDRLTLTMLPGHIDRIGAVAAIVWAIVWFGRQDLCYTNDRYYFAFHKFCQTLGATQQSFARSLKEHMPAIPAALRIDPDHPPADGGTAKAPNAFTAKPTDLKLS